MVVEVVVLVKVGETMVPVMIEEDSVEEESTNRFMWQLQLHLRLSPIHLPPRPALFFRSTRITVLFRHHFLPLIALPWRHP